MPSEQIRDEAATLVRGKLLVRDVAHGGSGLIHNRIEPAERCAGTSEQIQPRDHASTPRGTSEAATREPSQDKGLRRNRADAAVGFMRQWRPNS